MDQSNNSGDVPVRPLTLRERLWLLPIMAKLRELSSECPLLQVPVAFMVFAALAVAFGTFRENKHRTWSRAANLAVMRYLFNQKWDVYTLQSFIGATTTQVYQAWAAEEKVEAFTDILPENAKLHWIGPRQEGSQGRVLLYFFGEA